jgi:hypothetical protein
MVRFPNGIRLVVIATVMVASGFAVSASRGAASRVTLRISNESAPPGSIVQMKVGITESIPIFTGGGKLDFSGFDEIAGIALGDRDAAAVAVMDGSKIAVSLVSPNGALGIDSDYPILTVAGHIPATRPPNTTVAMTADPTSLQFVGKNGALQIGGVKQGTLTTASRLNISTVQPGSADMPAGGVVSISGNNFRPDTRIRLDEVPLAQTHVKSSTNVEVVLAEPARMHAMEIKARNPDGIEEVYFSYQRTARAATTRHLKMANIVPVFPVKTMMAASLRLSSAVSGVALQNHGASDTHVAAELRTATEFPVASAMIVVPSQTFVVLQLPSPLHLYRSKCSASILMPLGAPHRACLSPNSPS